MVQNKPARLWNTGICITGVLIFLGLVSACENDPDPIGLSIQPLSDKPPVFYFDTTTVASFTLLVDSVRSEKPQYSLLGNYFDPVFGSTDAGFLTQLTLSSLSFYPGEIPVLDSALLYLRINDYYGSSSALLQMRIYELNKQIYTDSSYWSNLDASAYFSSPEMGTVIFSPADTIVSLKLSPEIGHKLLGDSAGLATLNNFREYFYGFYFSADPVPNDGAIAYFDLLSGDSRLVVYYSNETGDSLSYTFGFSTTTARVNLFSHDLSQADPSLKIQHTGEGTTDSVTYVQAMSGVETLIRFPYLDRWTEEIPAVINKAVLEIPLELSDPTREDYIPPPKLVLIYKKDDGTLEYLPDMALGDEYSGGFHDKQNHVYSFNITSYYSRFLKGEHDDDRIYLRVSNYLNQANRVVVSGPGHSRPVKLKITYTRY